MRSINGLLRNQCREKSLKAPFHSGRRTRSICKNQFQWRYSKPRSGLKTLYNTVQAAVSSIEVIAHGRQICYHIVAKEL
jgi:hypothetical protein